MDFIPYGRQDITKDDLEAVLRTLVSDNLTQGPAVPSFEQALASATGASYVVAVNSATSALHIACLALGLTDGDVLWTSPISFVASANCGLYCGADVDFVDIDAATYNISVDALQEKLEVAEREGRIPKILVAVHMCGQSADMEAIKVLADRYGVAVVEDASHAIGGRYRGRPVGSCKFSDVTILSFHPVKIVTSGEGGAAVTHRPDLFSKMQMLRSHGITRESELLKESIREAWYYEQQELGYNYRMTDIHAALGESQLSRVDEYVSKRNEIAHSYNDKLSEVGISLPTVQPQILSSYHLYVVRIPAHDGISRRDEVFRKLRDAGIGVNLHYIPIYRQPFYRRFGYDPDHFPEAEGYFLEALTLPIYPRLTDTQLDYVVTKLKQAL